MNALAKKVLVVDDDPVIGRSIDRVLSEKGYAVSTASSGAEALRKFAGEDYDVVFTDIKMPGMDGLEVAGRMRERRPWIPVVIITGYGTAAHEATAEALGVADFIRKPLSPETIERSARKALRVIEGGAPRALFRNNATPAAPAAVAAIEAPTALAAVAAVDAPPAPVGRARGAALFAKNVALFIAAPFIGLAYALAFPLIGSFLLVRIGMKAWAKRSATNGAPRL